MPINLIKIDGLDQFRRNLRQVNRDLPKALRLAFNVAADLVVSEIKSRVPVRSGAARRSVKSQSTTKAVRVSVGGNQAPYFPWLDWGGATGRRKATVRPFYKEGRYLYPSFKDKRADLEKAVNDAIRRTVASAGIEVN